ncbi:RNA 2',3'-cyclic phosphodiesterase [Capillimicrobium parvum]|uniref:RNA 2',3'-cyclic phosphodiesterase n=1 Tax=Capillimicrobium parvum TaxID=2884022 RepID=A0A9E6XYP7_9ACTN|nr:RNA 2',3'-cyclic phosphodiesterase [Capillimicrobium parvum]UGS36685.1 RNA 2',3'-cyclic phosphodiesterase [Capillimicrobium parvum]
MRCFVAAELPEAVRVALVAWAPRDDALRVLDPESLHLTLAFLGERSDEEVAAVSALLGPLARPVRALSLGGVLWLPRGRPRVLAVEVADGDGALGAMQAGVVAALADAIGFRAEPRPFLAHATVARVRAHGRVSRDRRAAVEAASPPEAGTFAAPALTLLRSRLSPRGARYEPVARTEL